jgi:dihydrolipoamide dehydrogenase
VIGGLMLAHVASDEGKAAAENIMGLTGHINYDAIPNCIFSFPEIAVVGLNEEEAKARGISCKTGKFLFGANGKALTMGEEEGFIKVLAKTDTGEIIGVHIMGPHASDLIHEAVLMVDKKLTVEAVSKTVHAHPTLSEALIEAVLGVEGRAIHSAPTRVKQGFSETSRIHT